MDGQDRDQANVVDRLEYQELRRTIRTERGMIEVLRATTAGDPSVKRVHEMLTAQFGSRYAADNSAVLNAGLVVAELMREFGFIEDRRALPSGRASGGLRWRMPTGQRAGAPAQN